MAAIALLCGLNVPSAWAQWSMGAGDAGTAAGAHRYVYLVFANPKPGAEAEFNDWYLNVHLGDLVQLPGWLGAQRFRIVSDLTPRPTAAGYERGYLVIWDQAGTDARALRDEARAAIAGGKSRKSAAFDYAAGAALSATYRALEPRAQRAGGAHPYVPSADDSASPRRNRYLFLEFNSPAQDIPEAQFDAALRRRVNEVLRLPGWLAAQLFRLEQLDPAPPRLPSHLIVWEIESDSAQAADQVLREALRGGEVSALPVDLATGIATYWTPISPHITRADFQR